MMFGRRSHFALNMVVTSAPTLKIGKLHPLCFEVTAGDSLCRF